MLRQATKEDCSGRPGSGCEFGIPGPGQIKALGGVP